MEEFFIWKVSEEELSQFPDTNQEEEDSLEQATAVEEKEIQPQPENNSSKISIKEEEKKLQDAYPTTRAKTRHRVRPRIHTKNTTMAPGCGQRPRRKRKKASS